MVHVKLVCSDAACAERFEAFGRLEEIQALTCRCGGALTIVRWLGEVSSGQARFVTLLPAAA